MESAQNSLPSLQIIEKVELNTPKIFSCIIWSS